MAYFERYLRKMFQREKVKIYMTLKIYHQLCSMSQFHIAFQLRVPLHTFKEEARLQLVSVCRKN
jgi:adenine C2-methylase RlmN of 23S rRNA A2503 and tRNA A37